VLRRRGERNSAELSRGERPSIPCTAGTEETSGGVLSLRCMFDVHSIEVLTFRPGGEELAHAHAGVDAAGIDLRPWR
jgi:hypothetical protein